MRLADAQTGPSALSLAPLAYPMDAVRGGVKATVTVTVDVNADGSPVSVETTYKSASRSGFARQAFHPSATEVVKRGMFPPELVARNVLSGPRHRAPTVCVRPKFFNNSKKSTVGK